MREKRSVAWGFRGGCAWDEDVRRRSKRGGCARDGCARDEDVIRRRGEFIDNQQVTHEGME